MTRTGQRLLTAAVILHLGVAWYFIRHGALNPDEGFYAAAARAVVAGNLPYRDFGYTQPPLLPYINGPLLQLTGFGLFEQRTLNALWTALALTLAVALVARRASLRAAAGLLLLFTLTAPWMYFTHLGKTYAFTGWLTMLAAWLWLDRPAGWRRTSLLGLVAVLGVGCRLPALPYFAVLWLAALREDFRPSAGWLASALASVAVPAALLLLPFYLAAPEACRFWVVEFHRVSVPLKEWRLAWQEITTLAPALWLATAVAAGWALRRPDLVKNRAGVLALASLLALAANLLPAGVYEEYAVPFLLPLALALILVLHRPAALWPVRRMTLAVGALALVQALAAPVILWRDFPERRFTASQWLTPNAPRFNADLPGQLARARRRVQLLVPPGRPLIGPNLILALEADRPVPAEFIMGPFSVSASLPPETARRLHLATPADVTARLLDPTVTLLAFFPQPQLNYGWSVPTFERLPATVTEEWRTIRARDYGTAFPEGNFYLLARPAAVERARAAQP